MDLIRGLGILLALLGLARPAWPWGCEGHEIVARIAERHLTTHALRMVNDLLDPSPIDPHLQRACHSSTPDPMADVSTWADDVRGDVTSPFYGTGMWHFVDIPLGASPYDADRFCPRRGCVLTAINDQLAVLRAGGARHRRAEALMFVIHLVADLHQPLHCATNNDQGANCVPVAYFDLEPQLSPEHPESGVYQPNLHTAWDSHLVRGIAGHGTPAQFAVFLEQRYAAELEAWQRAPIDLRRWAWESHEVAVRIAYGKLPTPIAPRKPAWVTQCNQVSEKMLRLHERLGQRYQDAVAPALEEQLAKAGIRLATVLNHLWP
ncbi:MAG TPA: S1/P1 nuclease [Candidatus Acidoferrales bacterium]|nr:S1/P1 nuclease [Candidatus Acidoferrales bacterium]